jgi:hypothetical protein
MRDMAKAVRRRDRREAVDERAEGVSCWEASNDGQRELETAAGRARNTSARQRLEVCGPLSTIGADCGSALHYVWAIGARIDQ